MSPNRPARYAVSIVAAACVAFLIGLAVQSLFAEVLPFAWVAVIDVAIGIVCGVAAVILLRPWYTAPKAPVRAQWNEDAL